MNAIRILVVDDHGMMRKGLRSLLSEPDGLTVVGEASDGASALEQVRALAPQVVIMDIHLPDQDGVTISRQILTEFPSIKIIVLSGDSSLSLVQEALEAGVAGYVLKENLPEELGRAIRAVVDQHLYLCLEVSSVVARDYVKLLSEKTLLASKSRLTDRERQLLRLVAEGKRNKEIAAVLEVGNKSVEIYRSRLMKKLGCKTAIELARYAIREGLVAP